MRKLLIGLLFVGLVFVGVGAGMLLSNITRQQVEAEQYPLRLVEIGANEIDPAIWGQTSRPIMTAL